MVRPTSAGRQQTGKPVKKDLRVIHLTGAAYTGSHAGAWERAKQLVVLDRNNLGIPQGLTRSPRNTPLFPNHPGDMPEGALRAILRQANVTTDQFLNA